jgi:ABC-type multidrug transport system permease subunit
MKPHMKKYLLRLAVGMTGYVLGLFALNYFYTEHSPHRYWLILLPVLPLLYAVTAIIRVVTELDEMQRKIQMEAMAFSGLATGFTCFSYLFLRDMGAPEFHADWTYYIMWAYYFIGLFFSRRRYK